jgi:lipopolysaccharide transport system ATP-binding protein
MSLSAVACDGSSPPALVLNEVGKTYRLYDHPSHRLKQTLVQGRRHYFREHVALHPLSLTIPQGESVGVIGANGSGKSTLLQMVARTLTPTTGQLQIHGRVSALLELGAGFNPEFSGRENVFLNASIMGLSREEVEGCYEDIVAFSGLPPAMLSQPVSTYSSGMYVRLAFAVAIAVRPDILIVDEALAVGDEGFQRKCFARIRELQESGVTILFVSHSGQTIIDLCSHALLLDAGELLLQGAPSEVVAHYHRMLFATDATRAQVREQIKAGASVQASQAEESPPLPDTLDADDPAFAAPETRMEYMSDGATLSHLQLTRATGEESRRFIAGETARLSYRVTTERDLRHVRCSMMLKTMTGLELAGTLARPDDSAGGEHWAANQTYAVQFEVPLRLLPGDYFINVAVVEEMFGKYHFVHRIVDALHLKVIPAHEEAASQICKPRGCVDLGVTVQMAAC